MVARKGGWWDPLAIWPFESPVLPVRRPLDCLICVLRGLLRPDFPLKLLTDCTSFSG